MIQQGPQPVCVTNYFTRLAARLRKFNVPRVQTGVLFSKKAGATLRTSNTLSEFPAWSFGFGLGTGCGFRPSFLNLRSFGVPRLSRVGVHGTPGLKLRTSVKSSPQQLY